MREIELLAPARNAEIGIEAINCGADAVYIGAPAFGARHAAANSVADIARLVEYAHRYGVRVYVTLNTILYDSELEQARKLACQLADVGVDALIVQDMAYGEMNLPLPLHASTQMDNRTAQDVCLLHKLGYEQVVLARELGLDTIDKIHKACPEARLEAFVHGALCVSYSGRCYASQHCFGRSANRGECAQFCRLAFDLEDETGRKLLKGKHLLSLRDMNRSRHLEAMLDAGISSLKIEGRLKDLNYVKNVVAYYRKELDSVLARRKADYRRSSYGETHLDFVPDLAKCFNRGYTDYFLTSHNADVSSIDTPKYVGEPVGRVKEIRRGSFTVSGMASFHNGDGLCYFNSDGKLEGLRVNRVENNRLYPYPFPKSLVEKTALFRNRDVAFEQAVERPTAPRTIGVDISLRDVADGYILEITTESGRRVLLEKQAEKTLARTPQADRIRKELSKLGDTFFKANSVETDLADNYFIPVSFVAQWRRELVGLLLREMTQRRSKESACGQLSHTAILPVEGDLDFCANVSNKLAREFYSRNGVGQIEPAFEVAEPRGEDGRVVIMTCRHCVKYTLGLCVKNKSGMFGHKTLRGQHQYRLSLPDGRKFPLDFDCRSCEMKVLAESDNTKNRSHE